ncbi:helix-turn-helix domain-containing protein, partial [Pseudomonas sp. SIMBA_064]
TLVALCDNGRIESADLPTIFHNTAPPSSATTAYPDRNPSPPLQDAERQALLTVLEANRWHLTRVAEHLGISRNTLYRKL